MRLLAAIPDPNFLMVFGSHVNAFIHYQRGGSLPLYRILTYRSPTCQILVGVKDEIPDTRAFDHHFVMICKETLQSCFSPTEILRTSYVK